MTTLEKSSKTSAVSALAGPLSRLLSGRTLLWALLLSIVGSPVLLLVAIALNTGDPQQIPPADFGLDSVARVGEHWDWILNSLQVGLVVSVLATAIGLALAWIVARTDVPGKKWLPLLIILPYPMGPMVAAIAWASLGAPNNGLINSLLGEVLGREVTLLNAYSVPGIMLVQSLIQVPVCFLLIDSALRGMDASLEESSTVLGGSKLQTAMRITVPLMLPSIVGAALFTFVSALGAFAVPTVLGRSLDFRVTTEAVYNLFGSFTPDYPLAASLGLVLVAVSALLVFVSNRILRSRSFAVIGGKGRPPSPVRLGRWKPIACLVAYGYVFLGVVLPLGALIVASLQKTNRLDVANLTWTLDHYRYVVVEYPLTRESISNSLVLGVATGILGVCLAACVAIAVENARRAGRGGRAMEQLTMAPQAIPRLIFSLALLVLILILPIKIYGTIVGILAAYVVVFLPLAYRGVAGVVSQIDSSLAEAARTLGATARRATFSVTVPLLRSGLTAAVILLFMLSLTEVGAAIMLSSAGNSVLGPTLFNFYDSGGISLVSTLAMVQVLIVFVAIVGIRKVSGKWMSL